MAKIKLLTIHFSESIGGNLQTYAMAKYLQNLGHEVLIVNFIPDGRSLWNLAISNPRFLMILPNICRNRQFKKKFFPRQTKKYTSKNMSGLPESDYTVVGSDQVWNTDIVKQNLPTYFLNFVPDDEIRLSLSSSFGKKVWKESPELTRTIKAELQKFQAVAVREASGAQICRDVFDKDAVVLIDPTLALTDYSEITGPIKPNREIVAFMFSHSPLFYHAADTLKKKTGLPVRLLTKTYLTRLSKVSPRLANYKGWSLSGTIAPPDWLRNIGGASMTFSDSFHGIVFSILYRRPFVAFRSDVMRFERIRFLLESFGLEDRIVLSQEEFDAKVDRLLEPIDYDRVETLLQAKRMEYANYITQNIR